MMVMTAKVDLKKIMIILAAVAAVILAMILLLGNNGDSAQTAAPAVSGNDARVKFLTDLGWEVAASPVESGQVKIPEETGEVFDRYNTMQKGQGYDLTQFAGKKVMRYVYKVENYPGASAPVYATLLVHKNQVIGGDITNTAAKGRIHGLKMPAGTTPTESTATAPHTIN
jgi:hypothetical protein